MMLFTISTVIPTPMGKNTDLTYSNNYRAIASSSIFGKIIDLIFLINHFSDLWTSELQFGLKLKHSMIHCSMVLREAQCIALCFWLSWIL